jgi:hypothetical protein
MLNKVCDEGSSQIAKFTAPFYYDIAIDEIQIIYLNALSHVRNIERVEVIDNGKYIITKKL